ncbi:hypothetical protein TNCT_257821, partial [Trichonephila clavata]
GVTGTCVFKVLAEQEVVLNHTIVGGEALLGVGKYFVVLTPFCQLACHTFCEKLVQRVGQRNGSPVGHIRHDLLTCE